MIEGINNMNYLDLFSGIVGYMNVNGSCLIHSGSLGLIEKEYFLSGIFLENPDQKYFLSSQNIKYILQRGKIRGKTLSIIYPQEVQKAGCP